MGLGPRPGLVGLVGEIREGSSSTEGIERIRNRLMPFPLHCISLLQSLAVLLFYPKSLPETLYPVSSSYRFVVYSSRIVTFGI